MQLVVGIASRKVNHIIELMARQGVRAIGAVNRATANLVCEPTRSGQTVISGSEGRNDARDLVTFSPCNRWPGSIKLSHYSAGVLSTRGATAAADWAAHKRISLPRRLGRLIGIAGTGASLTARTMGTYLGNEKPTMLAAELVEHTHTIASPTPSSATGDGMQRFVAVMRAVADSRSPRPRREAQVRWTL
jgi:hypothetical protein